MEQLVQILSPLQGILVRALPTFVLVILLHWYLKKVLFQPMERVMEERRKKTEGAVEASEAMLAGVAGRLEQYEKSLSDARAAIYREQEASRKRLADEQAQAVEAARLRSRERVEAAKAEIAAEAQQATGALRMEADRLAASIATQLLSGRPFSA